MKKHSYKKIKSVIHNLGASFFSLMNTTDGCLCIDDLIYEAMEKGGFEEVRLNFSECKIEPEGDFSPEILASIRRYMERLPTQAAYEDVDSSRLKNIVVTVTKTVKGHSVSISASDDLGNIHISPIAI